MSRLSYEEEVRYLRQIAALVQDNPHKLIVGHGESTSPQRFSFGLAVFLLVTETPSTSFFLANDGYDIDQGMLLQHPEYHLPLGHPVGNFTQLSPSGMLHRNFVGGNVTVDLHAQTATIQCR